MKRVIINRFDSDGVFDRLESGRFIHSLECMILQIRTKGLWFFVYERFEELLNEKD